MAKPKGTKKTISIPEDKQKALELAKAAVEKEFGKGIVVTNKDHQFPEIERISSGCLGLDKALGGGYAKGRIVEISGLESCIDENTNIEIKDIGNILIRDLYDLFQLNHGYKCLFIKSIDENNNYIWNEILDVVSTGKKECFQVCDEYGLEIIATEDHKFLTPNGYTKLCNIKEYDYVCTHSFLIKKTHFSRISWKKVIGIRHTFDIKCAYPHNNYVANNFVVHNSGKTSLALHAIAECQKKGGVALFIDAEHALDLGYAENLGVDIDSMLLCQPSCVSENSLILTKDGYKKLKDLNEENDEIISFSGKFFEPSKFKVVNSDIKQCYKLETSCGISLASEDHKFKKFDRFLNLSDIRKNDYLEVPLKIDFPTRTNFEITRDDAIMLGCLIADGSFTREHIKYIKEDKGIIKWINDYIDKNYKDIVFKKINSDKFDYSFSKKIRSNKENKFSSFVHRYLGYVCKENKFVPKEIFAAGEEVISGMLCGLWSSDGSIYKNGVLEYSTISENIASSVMTMLKYFGIPYNYLIYKDKRKSTYKPLHRININSYEGLLLFKNKIGTIGRINITDNIISNKESFIKYPREIWNIIFHEIRKTYKTITKFSNIFFNKDSNRHFFNTKRGVSLNYLIKINEILKSEKLNDLINRPIYYAKVKRITKDIYIKTNDLMVYKNHNFICDNHIVHNCGEEALNVVDTYARSGAIELIIVDSVAALVPRVELEGDIGDVSMGLQARLMSQAMRMLTGPLYKTQTLVIFLNQIRMKINVMFSNPETVSGGNALKFYASQRLDIRKIDNIKTTDEQIGIRSRVKVVKNKVGAPFRTAEFNIMFGTGIDWAMDLLDSAVESKLINKSGAWFSYKGNNIGQGASNTAQTIRDNEELANELRTILTNGSNTDSVGNEVPNEKE